MLAVPLTLAACNLLPNEGSLKYRNSQLQPKAPMGAWTSTEAERQLPAGAQLYILSLLFPNHRALGGRLAFRAASVTSTNSAQKLQLPSAIQLHILSFLPSNYRALSGRLVSPDAAAALAGPEQCTASLSEPLPTHAVAWAVEAGQQHVRQLPFWLKPKLLCTAAVSGSKLNLEIAWKILQPSIFPERQFGSLFDSPDPGVAAVKAGHPQLLAWLACRCPELLSANSALQAAAQHSDLAGLQAAWDAVRRKLPINLPDNGVFGKRVDQRVMDAAAGSATGDAVAKMEWHLSTADYRLLESTAQAGARSGDLGRLRWLWEQGCQMDGEQVLVAALEHAGLAVAQWLVDEAGCGLPAAGADEDSGWSTYFQAAARSADAFAKFHWLQERGGPPLQTADEAAVCDLVLAAAGAGQAEVLRHLLSLMRDGQVKTENHAYGNAAAGSGSIPTAEILLQAGARFDPSAYEVAYQPENGSMAMVRWLAAEAGVRVASVEVLLNVTNAWARSMATASRMSGSTVGQPGMLEAVQLAVGEGPHDWADTDWTGELMCHVHEMGNLGLAQFLLGVLGFKPDRGTLEATAEGGCEALLEWLVEQHPGCVEGASPYVPAARNGDRATLVALRRLGVPWGPLDTVARAAAGRSPAQALRWLVEQGAPVGRAEEMREPLQEAVKLRLSAETVAWLRGLVAG